MKCLLLNMSPKFSKDLLLHCLSNRYLVLLKYPEMQTGEGKRNLVRISYHWNIPLSSLQELNKKKKGNKKS